MGGYNFRGSVSRVPEKYIVWSEMGSGFGEPYRTPPPPPPVLGGRGVGLPYESDGGDRLKS